MITNENMVSIQNFSVRVGSVDVVKNCSLNLASGQVHAIMGPNGSGKSSLLMSLMGHPDYQIIAGQCLFYGSDITTISSDKKSLQGLFLSMQHPVEIEGLSVLSFLQEIVRIHGCMQTTHAEFIYQIKELLVIVGLSETILQRSVNVGFSGGEKKRFELLQMFLIKPKCIMLDEIDSGVDIDGLKLIANALHWYKKQCPEAIFLLVTHYRRILDYFPADVIHVMVAGSIVYQGDQALLQMIEQKGYAGYEKRSE